MKYLTLIALLVGCKDPYADDSSADDSNVTTDDSTADDSATDDSAVDDSGQTQDQDIVGSWISEGSNISPLFQSAFFSYVSIVAEFTSDSKYSVVATDGEGADTTFEGSYVVDITGSIPTIVLTQTAPSAATAEGIWQLQSDELHYEVVQTNPNPYNFVAPTPETGFGSSSGPGLQPGDNVQIYVKN